MRVLIADDEPLARARLRELLSAHPDVAAVAEAEDGEAARRTLSTWRPDVLLLDVRMPGIDGLSLAASLPDGAAPAIVFVTAHDRYALRAFDVAAVDYLLKPFDRERFDRALERARGHIAARRSPPEVGPRLAVPDGERVRYVPCASIEHVAAAGNYVALLTGGQELLLRATLAEVEARLAGAGFVRVHRGHLVNRARVREVTALRVVLDSGRVVPLSKRYAAALRLALGR
jgi:two-component system LytT family response regulator